jgi:hypothetical protein
MPQYRQVEPSPDSLTRRPRAPLTHTEWFARWTQRRLSTVRHNGKTERRYTATGYGITVFDLDPGKPNGKTTITVRYYHGPGADKTPTGTYELFDIIVLSKHRRNGFDSGAERI